MLKIIIMSIIGLILLAGAAILWRDSDREKKTIDILPTTFDNRLYTLEWMSSLNEYEYTIHLRNSKEYKKTKKWLTKQLANLKGEIKEYERAYGRQ